MTERQDTHSSPLEPDAPFWFEQPNWKPFNAGSRGGPDGGHPSTRPHFELDNSLLNRAGRELLLRAKVAQESAAAVPVAEDEPVTREEPVAIAEPAGQQESVLEDRDEDEFTRRYREEWERELAAHPSHRNMPAPAESPRRRPLRRAKRSSGRDS